MADYEDPFDELRKIQHKIGQMLRGRPESVDVMRPGTVTVPDVDVEEKGDDIIVTADMPGVDKGDIQINVTEDNVLEISAEKREETKREEKNFVRHERTYNRYYRAIRLPVPVDKANAKACYRDGVLEVTMPMVHRTRSSEIPIS